MSGIRQYQAKRMAKMQTEAMGSGACQVGTMADGGGVVKIKWYRFLVWFYSFIGKTSKAGIYLGKIYLLGFMKGLEIVTGFMEGLSDADRRRNQNKDARL